MEKCILLPHKQTSVDQQNNKNYYRQNLVGQNLTGSWSDAVDAAEHFGLQNSSWPEDPSHGPNQVKSRACVLFYVDIKLKVVFQYKESILWRNFGFDFNSI